MSIAASIPNPASYSIAASNSGSVDAFSRWRTSSPVTLYDNMQQYGNSALYWEDVLTGGASVVNALAESSVKLRTGSGALGASVVRQSRLSLRYQPGKSQVIINTWVMDGGAKANVRRRAGYFDASNGIYFQLSGSTMSIVRRSSASGVLIEEVVDQADWTIDKLNGSGPSKIDLDISRCQILFIDLQWLGMGRVRVGFDIDGVLYYAHEFLNANNLTLVYMTTGCLPVRYEIENIGAAAGSTDFTQTCTAVISEGGFEGVRGLQFTANLGASPLTVTTRRPVLSIRAKTTGPNGVRNIGQILPRDIDLMAGGNAAIYELVLNPTTLTAGGGAPAWTDVDATYSITQRNTNANAIAGGIILASGNIPAGSAVRGVASGDTFYRELPLVYTGLLNVQDTLCVVVTSTGGNATINASLIWQELY